MMAQRMGTVRDQLPTACAGQFARAVFYYLLHDI